MRIRHLVLAAAMSFCLGASVLPGIAAETSGPVVRIATSGSATPPLGLQIFCLRTPSFCSGAAAELKLDAATQAMLSSVNRSVNASIQPQVRRAQTWQLGASAGDCKDYAMNKRAALIARGVPAGALRLAVGFTSRGEGHAVLVVRTNQGDLVLDNLTSEIMPANRTGLRLVSMSSPDLRRWHRIS